MIAELTIAGLGIACTLPGLISEYTDDFEASEWGTWVKLLPQLLLIAGGVLRFLRKFEFTLGLSAAALALTYFCVLFNTSSSTAVACVEYDAACLDENMVKCSGSPLEPWEGLLYLAGLALMTIGSTLLVKESASLRGSAPSRPRKVQQKQASGSPRRSPTLRRPR